MKILHLLNTDRYSGAENVVCQIIDMFKGDQEVEMVYCSPSGPIREILAERNIYFSPIEKLSVREVKRVIKQEKPDLIHAHDFRASIISSAACGNIPVISHLHNNSPWLQKHGVYSFVYGATCRKYKAILTVSESVFNEFVFGDKFRNKLTVLGNPVNIREIRSKAGAVCKEKVYDLGFCGRFSTQKKPEGFIDIVEALHKEMPDLKAAMIGSGEQYDEMLARIKGKSLEGVITLFGFLENPYEIMKTCKILCVPSRWEGFGLVAVEALALGVPVVCSNVGGLPDIVNEKCGKVCRDEAEMTEECLRLFCDGGLLQKTCEGAYVRATELDNMESYRQRLETIYRSVGALN